MKNRTAVVTGGSRGIGKAVALKLASLGANVVINYAGNVEAAINTAEECKTYGVEAVVVQGDVSNSADCKAIVEAAVNNFGTVDILVNNAGITRDNLMIRMSEEEFDEVIATNLKGTYLMMKAVSRQMLKQKYGRIVNMSSVVGIMGNPGQVNYSASKGGVIAMTKSFAREIATKGITVNAVAPGFIATDMTKKLSDSAADAISAQIPMNRMGSPEDVADVVAFLSREDTRYVTGQVINVDGGML